jgi:hypothetical protein
MGKRKLDEFLELAKDLSASEIAESLSTLGPVKFRRILSDPKVSTGLSCTCKPFIFNMKLLQGLGRVLRMHDYTHEPTSLRTYMCWDRVLNWANINHSLSMT